MQRPRHPQACMLSTGREQLDRERGRADRLEEELRVAPDVMRRKASPHKGRLTQMSRTDHITILVVSLAGVVGVAAAVVLTLLEVQEWIKFAVMLVTFAVILAGTYWFVLAQSDRRNGQER